MRTSLIVLFLFGLLGLSNESFGQKMIKAMEVDYKIEIEVGRDPKRPELRPKPMVVFNRMYIGQGKAAYVKYDSTKTWQDYTAREKTILWRKGKTSFKYEYQDSACCVMYSEVKQRYRTENTNQEEMIAGKRCKKVIVFDDMNKKTYLVWFAVNIDFPISPVGFLPVGGMVMRLRNENVVYEVTRISEIKVDNSFLFVDEDKFKFSETEFLGGFIE